MSFCLSSLHVFVCVPCATAIKDFLDYRFSVVRFCFAFVKWQRLARASQIVSLNLATYLLSGEKSMGFLTLPTN